MAYMTNREFAEHEYNRQKQNAYADALVKEVRRLREENEILRAERDALLKPWDYLPGAYWAVHKPPVCGMDNGIPSWMGGYKQYKERMTCYGNAVVPQQAYPIFKAIAQIENAPTESQLR